MAIKINYKNFQQRLMVRFTHREIAKINSMMCAAVS